MTNNKDLSMTRIGVFYDGNYFLHVSNFYNYFHERKSRISISGLHHFIRNNVVEHCIISRYSEYIPFTLKSQVKNVYFVAHDLTPTGIIFPLEDKFKKVFCLSEWHVEYFTNIFPQLKHITVPFYYGIDKDLFYGINMIKKN
jgi:hypothetical protein